MAAKNDPKTIFGWCMYDWANSAYITTAVTLVPVYITTTVVGQQGTVIAGRHYHPDSLWGFMVGGADILAFVAAPVLGAMADFSASKKKFLLWFAYIGALFTMLLYLSHAGDVFRTAMFFMLAQFAFVSSNVLYDAFLPQIASADKMDWVSGKGYAYGYVGGGLQLAVALGLIAGHQKLGISQEMAMRVGIATAGLWWAIFTLVTARNVPETGAAQAMPPEYRGWPRTLAMAAIGVARTLKTTRRVRRFRHLVLFLVAFMLYNDGIQTVINLATAYGSVELRLAPWVVMLTFLMIQGIATFGALLFGKIAERIGAKHAIMISLVLWSAVVIYAYFIRTAGQFFALGAIVGVVLGGSQALSRSFYGSMIPEEASAEFFGFYTVFTKFSAIWGPFAFAIIKQMTGSSRLAVVSLMIFFIAGLLLLHFVNETKAREAKAAGAF